MQYADLIAHIIEQGCSEVEGSTMPANPPLPETSIYRNCVCGNICQIPKENLGSKSCCHIFSELNIDPMPELEDDYAIYTSFKIHAANQMKAVIEKNGEN